MEYGNWEKWIFIDDAGVDDVLKYDINPLGLDNLQNIAITFNVRGAWLKPRWNDHWLFRSNWNDINLYMNSGWHLKLKIDSQTLINFKVTDNMSIEANDFYDVTLIRQAWNWRIKINDSLSQSYDSNIASESKKIAQYIYMYKSWKEWWDVLNYIKIYTK